MTKKIKILYIGNKLTRYGYNPTSVDTLGELLKQKFSVVTYSQRKSLILRILDMWLSIIRHRDAHYLLIDTYSTSAFHFAWSSAWLANQLGMSYIPILHGGSLPQRAVKSPRLVRLFLDQARLIVSPSGYLKETMSAKTQREIKVIPNFIEISTYPFQQRYPINTGKSPKLLWVRAFAQIYRPKWAIDILEGLLAFFPDARLCMVGPEKDGSLLETRTYATEKGLNPHVTFTGKLSKQDWISLSASYDVFINTTSVDNTPVSIIEAMALGFPIISTNVGGLRYLIDHGINGMLIQDQDTPEAFVDTICQLVKDESLVAMSRQARSKAEKFDSSYVLAMWENTLKS